MLTAVFIAAMLLIFQNIPGTVPCRRGHLTAAMVAVTYMLIGNACAYAEKAKKM